MMFFHTLDKCFNHNDVLSYRLDTNDVYIEDKIMCTLESGHRCEQTSLTLHVVVIFHRVRYQTVGFRICRKENLTTSPVYRGDEICLTSTTVSWSQHDGRRREGKRKNNS